ncbi:MAG: phosphatase PAP2 family protein [Promethearchaeota archaeon]|jgi:membrane-associated phospholipid phosphatase
MLTNLKNSFVAKLSLNIIVLWIMLALIFGFTDLEISIAVVDENSSWGNFGREFGEVPGWGLIAIALSTFIGGYNENIKKQKIPAYVIIFIGIVLFILGVIDKSSYLMLIGGSMTISLVLFTLISFKKDWGAYRKISTVITVLTVINPLVFIQITKIFWGRVRFRDLSPSFIEYTPWFIPQGITGNQSFPSGHTAMAWMLLPLIILITTKDWKTPIKIIITTFVVGWGIFVAFSRVAIGAHYASDVLFSTGIATMVTLLLYKKFYLKQDTS